MYKILAVCFGVLFVSHDACGQDSIPRKIIKWDMAVLRNQKLSLALELRNTPNVSFEFRADMYVNSNIRTAFQDREKITEYAVETIKKTGWGPVAPYQSEQYYGSGRPFATIKDGYEKLFSVDFQLGCIRSFLFGHQKWRVVTMPYLLGTINHYKGLEKEDLVVTKRESTAWIETIQGQTNEEAVQKISIDVVHFRQTRVYPTFSKFDGGLGYNFGITRFLSKKWCLEARFGVGYRFTSFKGDIDVQQNLKGGFTQYSLMAGYVFR